MILIFFLILERLVNEEQEDGGKIYGSNHVKKKRIIFGGRVEEIKIYRRFLIENPFIILIKKSKSSCRKFLFALSYITQISQALYL